VISLPASASLLEETDALEKIVTDIELESSVRPRNKTPKSQMEI
jgi:hypothetical protein